MIAAAVVTGTACQSPLAPEDEPAPQPAPALRHNVAVVLRRIDIEGGCEGKDILGDEKKGHFAYRDSNMDGRSKSQTRYARDGRQFYELNLGSGGCRIELEYAIDWSTP